MTQAPATADEFADQRRELIELKALYERAVKDNNLDALRPHLDEQFAIVTFTDREFTDFETFKARWNQTRARLLRGGSYAVELVPERARFVGDLAVARGDSKNVLITGSGKRYEFGSHWTVVCRKVDGRWKILRAHSSLDPFHNPVLRESVRKVVTLVCACSLVAGIVFGGALMYLFTR